MARNRATLGTLVLSYFLWVARGSKVKNISDGVSRHIRSIGFPEGSGMGIFFALGVPVDIPDKSILFSFYFEANYRLPGDWNSTYFPERIYMRKRALDRRLAYEILENKLESAGYPGRICLSKTICEAARNPLTENGLLGDILQILFTPSSSQDEHLPDQLIEAEHIKDCEEHYKECNATLLDHISHYISSEKSS